MPSFCIRALLAFSTRSDSGEMRGVESGGRKAEERERERQREGGRWVHLFCPLSPIPHPLDRCFPGHFSSRCPHYLNAWNTLGNHFIKNHVSTALTNCCRVIFKLIRDHI